jgi:two-component system sensor histidine kinase BaeS
VIRERPVLGSPLGRRLLAAFLLVALSSVAVLTGAALVAADRGLAGTLRAQRATVADRVATAVAAGYAAAGGWPSADLRPASALADAAGARLVVIGADGIMVSPGHGRGTGMGMHTGPSAAMAEAPVEVAGRRVGTVRLVFPDAIPAGRRIAWSWIGGAAAVALLTALAVSAYVTRRLTRPLLALAATARRFAAGDRSARSTVSAPGEMGDVIHAFDAMADDVVRAETVRRRLAADVAHELRTPLAALQAGLEELRDGLRAPDAGRLGALHDQSLRLGRVVTDLADLAAAESAALSLRPVRTDLAGIAAAAVAGLHPQLEASGLLVEVGLGMPLPVHGDPDRLYQVVANLLANAARYCAPGDRVSVRGRIEDAHAVLEVADTGPGIRAGELPHVFERLWRGEATRHVPGSGIGLAVVRELVAAHAGTATAASGDGAGTVITIRIPLATTAVPVPAPVTDVAARPG